VVHAIPPFLHQISEANATVSPWTAQLGPLFTLNYVDYTKFHGKRMPNNQRLPKIAAYLSLFHHEDGFSFDIKF
jgi:hypothetical protein